MNRTKTIKSVRTMKIAARVAQVSEYYWRGLVYTTQDKARDLNSHSTGFVLGDLLDDVADRMFSDEDFTSAIRADGLEVSAVKKVARDTAYAELKRRGVLSVTE